MGGWFVSGCTSNEGRSICVVYGEDLEDVAVKMYDHIKGVAEATYVVPIGMYRAIYNAGIADKNCQMTILGKGPDEPIIKTISAGRVRIIEAEIETIQAPPEL